MEDYFVAYDYDDNAYYIGNIRELCLLTGYKPKYFNFRFKNTNCIPFYLYNEECLLYKFRGAIL